MENKITLNWVNKFKQLIWDNTERDKIIDLFLQYCEQQEDMLNKRINNNEKQLTLKQFGFED